jgi:RimJ/RimL family protein N-acetyltransferase
MVVAQVPHESANGLVLRPPRLDDNLTLFYIFGDPRTQQFNPAGPLVNQQQADALLERWLGHWARHGFGPWAIATVQAPDAVVGFGGLDFRNYGENVRLNLGFRFAPEAWGHGYATELGRRSLRFAFDELEQAAVFGLVRPSNLASIRVLEKLGMVREGTLDDTPPRESSFIYKCSNPGRAAT